MERSIENFGIRRRNPVYIKESGDILQGDEATEHAKTDAEVAGIFKITCKPIDVKVFEKHLSSKKSSKTEVNVGDVKCSSSREDISKT